MIKTLLKYIYLEGGECPILCKLAKQFYKDHLDNKSPMKFMIYSKEKLSSNTKQKVNVYVPFIYRGFSYSLGAGLIVCLK